MSSLVWLRFWLFAALVACGIASAGAEEIRLRDITGREVVLPGPAKRILLGDGHLLVALALVHPDPSALVVASQGDLRRHSPAVEARFRDVNRAAMDRIVTVGEASPDSFSIERALAADPDVAILGGTYGPSIDSTEIVAKLEAAGVPVVAVDFYTSPLQHTAESIRLLGRIVGGSERGEAFARFYEERIRRIRDRVAELPAADRPRVMLQAFGGAWPCCWLPGAGLGEFVEAAGGRNIGGSLFPGRAWGQASLEFVLDADPAIYVTTGNPHVARTGGVVLGAGVARVEAERSFAALLREPTLAALPPVRGGHAYALWHLLHGLPLNVIALEALARWTHPAVFGDVDAAGTMEEINRRFLAVPLPGTYLIGPP